MLLHGIGCHAGFNIPAVYPQDGRMGLNIIRLLLCWQIGCFWFRHRNLALKGLFQVGGNCLQEPHLK
jgi:hypothetical protein